jgi:hypothetical protein
VEGILTCNRIRWLATRNRLTPFLLRAMKKRKARKDINKIKWKGKDLSNPEEIVKAGAEYYQNLFAEKPSESKARASLIGNLTTQLSEDSKNSLEGEVSRKEMEDTLYRMKKDKAPGLDELP